MLTVTVVLSLNNILIHKLIQWFIFFHFYCKIYFFYRMFYNVSIRDGLDFSLKDNAFDRLIMIAFVILMAWKTIQFFINELVMSIITKYHYYTNQSTLFACKRVWEWFLYEAIYVHHFKLSTFELKALIQLDYFLIPSFLMQPSEVNFMLNHIMNVNVS